MGLMLNAKKKREEKAKRIFVDGIPHIWVEGYKGTNKDMCCRGFQYELNKEFVCEGKASKCENGFHFCTYLGQVIDNWYHFDGNNRYFKVKALIPLEDSKYKEDKYAAKKIILLEEVGYKQLERYIKEECPSVKSEEDWIRCKEIGYEEFCKGKFKTEMSKYGYSETFIDVLFDDKGGRYCDELIQKAKAFYEEKVSKDLAVYMLMSY